jgi:hypothetical protein
VGRVCRRHGHRFRPLNSLVRGHVNDRGISTRLRLCEISLTIAVICAVASSAALSFDSWFKQPITNLPTVVAFAGAVLFGFIGIVLARGLPAQRPGTYPKEVAEIGRGSNITSIPSSNSPLDSWISVGIYILLSVACFVLAGLTGDWTAILIGLAFVAYIPSRYFDPVPVFQPLGTMYVSFLFLPRWVKALNWVGIALVVIVCVIRWQRDP